MSELLLAAIPIGAAATAAAAKGVVGIVVWARDQKARIDQHDQNFLTIAAAAAAYEKKADERHNETRDWLARIESKL